jgi:DNA polymerase III delta prime subunit
MSVMRKYKPKTLDEITFADPNVRKKLQEYADGRRVGHAILHGPYGTGKSAAVQIVLEKALGNAAPHSLIPANRRDSNIVNIAENWTGWARLNSLDGLVGIDEADLMSQTEAEKLRYMMDRHKGSVILITNHLHAIPPYLRDRCDTIAMERPNPLDRLPEARHVLQQEGVTYNDELLTELLSNSTGSVRDFSRIIDDLVLANK